jgi:hypothetical protein
MKPASLISSVQSDALTREIEQQLKDETGAVMTAAERDASATVAQARATARSRMHEAIADLRREGARRLARAKAQLETEERAQAQRRAAQAVSEALPLLRDAIAARWRDAPERKQWTEGVARLCRARLRNSFWLVEHPADWSEQEQQDFLASLGAGETAAVSFKPDSDLTAGLRIKADHALLDATPQGLLADGRTVAALLLDEIETQS